MTWFKVDDSFHAHPKVLATDADALGLWVVAGAWSSEHLTDGFVPDRALTRLLPGSDVLAAKLVASGLWRRAKGGYRFHDWTDFNPGRSQIDRTRSAKTIASRAGNHRRWHVEKGVRNPDCDLCLPKPVSHMGSQTDRSEGRARDPVGNPPVPEPRKILGGDLSGSVTPPADSNAPPSPRCTRRQDAPSDAPGRACGDARRATAAWEAAEAERRRTWPTCRRHRGQPAHNCGPCRSEALTPPDDEED